MACIENQALLHCPNKAALYAVEMTLGKRIQAARKDRRLGQDALARPFEITVQSVSSWERDCTAPDINKLPTIARILKIPLAWLLAGDGPPPDEDDLFVLIEALPASKQRHVRNYLKMLRDDDSDQFEPDVKPPLKRRLTAK